MTAEEKMQRIVRSAIAFVDAIDTDAQIDAVAKQALNEWVDLADAVITGRSAVSGVDSQPTAKSSNPKSPRYLIEQLAGYVVTTTSAFGYARALQEIEEALNARETTATHVAILQKHGARMEAFRYAEVPDCYKAVLVPPGQSLDFDPESATRRWLWPHLGRDYHLAGFLEVSSPPKTNGVDMSGQPTGDPHPCDLTHAGLDPVSGQPDPQSDETGRWEGL